MNSGYARWRFVLIVLLTTTVGLYLSGWLFGALKAVGDILTLYFTAWLLQFLFTPVVDALARRRVPRLVSVSLVYVSLTTIIATLLVWTVPAVYEQGQYVLGQLSKPQTYGFISSATNGVERFLVQHGVPSKDISHFTHDYSVSLKTGAPNAGSQLQKIIRSRLDPSALANSTTSFVAFLSTFQAILINAVLVLILAFYMTLDGHKLMRRALSYSSAQHW